MPVYSSREYFLEMKLKIKIEPLPLMNIDLWIQAFKYYANHQRKRKG